MKTSRKWKFMQKRMIKGYQDKVFSKFLTEEIFKRTFKFQPPFGKILDVGCYDGRLRKFIKIDGIDYFGLDPVDLGIKGITVGFAEKMPFETNYFDVVYIISSFDHFEKPKKVIKECYRVLREGGYLVLVNTIRPKRHIKEYTKEEFLRFFFKGKIYSKVVGKTLFAKAYNI